MLELLLHRIYVCALIFLTALIFLIAISSLTRYFKTCTDSVHVNLFCQSVLFCLAVSKKVQTI